jgi:hypothetical protein
MGATTIDPFVAWQLLAATPKLFQQLLQLKL